MVSLEKRPAPYAHGLNGAIAAEVRAERAAAEMTIEQLAQASGLDRAVLSRYLNGQREIPIAVLANVARALGLKPSELVQAAEDRMRRIGEILEANRVSGEELPQD